MMLICFKILFIWLYCCPYTNGYFSTYSFSDPGMRCCIYCFFFSWFSSLEIIPTKHVLLGLVVCIHLMYRCWIFHKLLKYCWFIWHYYPHWYWTYLVHGFSYSVSCCSSCPYIVHLNILFGHGFSIVSIFYCYLGCEKFNMGISSLLSLWNWITSDFTTWFLFLYDVCLILVSY